MPLPTPGQEFTHAGGLHNHLYSTDYLEALFFFLYAVSAFALFVVCAPQCWSLPLGIELIKPDPDQGLTRWSSILHRALWTYLSLGVYLPVLSLMHHVLYRDTVLPSFYRWLTLSFAHSIDLALNTNNNSGFRWKLPIYWAIDFSRQYFVKLFLAQHGTAGAKTPHYSTIAAALAGNPSDAWWRPIYAAASCTCNFMTCIDETRAFSCFVPACHSLGIKDKSSQKKWCIILARGIFPPSTHPPLFLYSTVLHLKLTVKTKKSETATVEFLDTFFDSMQERPARVTVSSSSLVLHHVSTVLCYLLIAIGHDSFWSLFFPLYCKMLALCQTCVFWKEK